MLSLLAECKWNGGSCYADSESRLEKSQLCLACPGVLCGLEKLVREVRAGLLKASYWALEAVQEWVYNLLSCFS